MKPIFEKLAKENPSIKFVHIDIDQAKEKMESKLKDIECVPTFEVYKNGQLDHIFTGADVNKLKKGLAQLKGEEYDENTIEIQQSSLCGSSQWKYNIGTSLLLLVSIFFIAIGIFYINSCPVNNKIPIWLIVNGIVFSVMVFISSASVCYLICKYIYALIRGLFSILLRVI